MRGISESISNNVNLNDHYAIVRYGGSIGETPKHPVFIKGGIGTIIATSNDKASLQKTAKSYRTFLSPGERKYYGMGYTVIEITPSVKKNMEYIRSQILLTKIIQDE